MSKPTLSHDSAYFSGAKRFNFSTTWANCNPGGISCKLLERFWRHRFAAMIDVFFIDILSHTLTLTNLYTQQFEWEKKGEKQANTHAQRFASMFLVSSYYYFVHFFLRSFWSVTYWQYNIFRVLIMRWYVGMRTEQFIVGVLRSGSLSQHVLLFDLLWIIVVEIVECCCSLYSLASN